MKRVYEREERERLEREAQRVFGPVLWGSDYMWDILGCNAGIHALFCPLRKPIQALAHKHRHRSAVFDHEFHRLVDRHFQEWRNDPVFQWNVAQFRRYLERVKASSGSPSEASPVNFFAAASHRKLAAFDSLVSTLLPAIIGRRVKAEPKKLIANLGALASGRPGPEPSAERKQILALDAQAREHGKPLVGPAEMAAKVFSSYATFSRHYRRKAQDFVVDVRRSYKR